MQMAEAKNFVGQVCTIHWSDRNGKKQQTISKIYDVTYVRFYGGYLITDSDEIRLDRVLSLSDGERTLEASPMLQAA